MSANFQFETLPGRMWQTLVERASAEIPLSGFNVVNDEPDFSVNFGPGGLTPPGMQIAPGVGFQIGVGPGGLVIGGAQPGNSPPVGKTFRVIVGNEVHEEISIHRNRLTYATTIYDRWGVFRDRLAFLTSSFFDAALSVATLNVVRLEYWDRFVFRGASSEADFRQLLQPNSKYVGNFTSDIRELWHSHVGFFADPGSSRKRLLNLNVDAIDLNEVNTETGEQVERRSVGIYSLAQDNVDAEKSPRDMGQTISTLEEMHSILKEVLRGVITAEAADRISLNA